MAKQDELTAQDDAQFQREAQAAQQALVNWVVQAAATDWSGNQPLRVEVEQRIAAAVSAALEESLPGQARLVELGTQQARAALSESLGPIAQALTSLRNEQTRMANEVAALRKAIETLPPPAPGEPAATSAGEGQAPARSGFARPGAGGLAGARLPLWMPVAGIAAAATVAVVVILALVSVQNRHLVEAADANSPPINGAGGRGAYSDSAGAGDPAADPQFEQGWRVFMSDDEARRLGRDCRRDPKDCEYASVAGPDAPPPQRAQVLNDAVGRLATSACKPKGSVSPPGNGGDLAASDVAVLNAFAGCLSLSPPAGPQAGSLASWIHWSVDALAPRSAPSAGTS